MKKLIFILLIIVSIGGCKKNENSIPEQVIGKWEWVKTIIPYGGQETNPQTAGFSMSLEFSNNGTVKEYKNGLLIGTSSYDIKTDQNGNVLSSTVITSHFYFANGTLIFSEAYLDGPVSTYIRLR
jgi:hypothetical protein